MPRLEIRSIKFEGPLYDAWPPSLHTRILPARLPQESEQAYAIRTLAGFATRAWRRPYTNMN